MSSYETVTVLSEELEPDDFDTETFSSWWPPTAMLILTARETHQKRNALAEISKLAYNKFPKVQESTIRMRTTEANELWSLYGQKVDMIETYNISLKTTYCAQITRALNAYQECTRAKDHELEKLTNTFRRFEEISHRPTFRGVHIDDTTKKRLMSVLHEEYTNHHQMLNLVYDCHMEVLTHKLSHVAVVPQLCTKRIDEDIAKQEDTMEDKTITAAIRKIYKQNIKNIDYTMAEQLATESMHWVEYLQS